MGEKIVYSLYDIRTGDIFFKLEVDVINKLNNGEK